MTKDSASRDYQNGFADAFFSSRFHQPEGGEALEEYQAGISDQRFIQSGIAGSWVAICVSAVFAEMIFGDKVGK